MTRLKIFLYFLYTLISNKKVVIVRDIKTNMSFVYRNLSESDYLVKEQCDQNFNFCHEPDLDIKGVKGMLLPKEIILMVIDLHSVISNKILTLNEKKLIINSFLNKDSDLLIET